MPKIRPANPTDAKNLAELADRTFRDAFSEQNTPENMDLHCKASYGERIQAEELADRQYTTLVAEVDGRLIAYAQLRWGEPPICVNADTAAEIQRIYVDREWHGKGLAQELMQACLKIIQASNIDTVWLGVWEHNPRAIAFYRKFDFQECGDHVFSVGSDPQRDVILVKRMTRL